MLGLIFARSPSALQRLTATGREYESQGHLRRAEWAYSRVVELGSPSSTAYFDLGRIQTRRGNLAEAKRNYARCLELKPDFYLCRVNFFETCRQEYWTYHPAVLVQVEQRLAGPESTTELRMRRMHLLLSGGMFQQMRFEVSRLDFDDLDTSVYDRLVATQAALKKTGREERAFARRLEETCRQFERLKGELTELQPLFALAAKRRVRVHLRKRPPVNLVGLRDTDDLIGHHLEIISGGRLSFLGLERIRRIEFGLHGEFIETALEMWDGSRLTVVVPGLYYGSQQSTLPELQRGEFSMFKDVYQGIQVGVGRRVMCGIDVENLQNVAIGIHEIQTIEFT